MDEFVSGDMTVLPVDITKIKMERQTPEKQEHTQNGSTADEKKPLSPVKSSSELLAELFQVFNAQPPASLLEQTAETTSRKLKKHKHKRKHKKHKREGEESCDDNTRASKHKKKSKKSKRKKHNKSCSESESGHYSEASAKSEVKNFPPGTLPPVDLKKVTEKPPPVCKPIELSNPPEDDKPKISDKAGPRRIIIEDLKNSSLFRSVENSKERRQSSSEKSEGNSSVLTLSDEETYEKERHRRNRFYEHERYSEYYYRERHQYRSHDSRRWSPKYDRRSNDRHKRRRSRSRSHSRTYDSPPEKRDIIDKKRLLEIARRNAITMLKNGQLTNSQGITSEAQERLINKMQIVGGKTVEELTEYCKKLCEGESLGNLSSLSSGESDGDSDHDRDGKERAFKHPFVLKDRGPIVMNIRNAKPLPPRTSEQAKAILTQFPVSSGQQHRVTENIAEWVPVVTKNPLAKFPSQVATVGPVLSAEAKKQLKQQPLAFIVSSPEPTVTEVAPKSELTLSQPVIIPPLQPPPALPALLSSYTPETKSFIAPSVANKIEPIVDVSSIIARRLTAMRRLQENADDSQAKQQIADAHKNMSIWANSKYPPGQFTGSTGANILSAKELASGYQPWARRDQFLNTTPVSGGVGMHLLQKMGWKPGEGLGKDRTGSLHPLAFEVKLDKKGLVAIDDFGPPLPPLLPPPLMSYLPQQSMPEPHNMGGPGKRMSRSRIAAATQALNLKHPVSLLGEISSKRKWLAPMYEVVAETGPSHNRQFLFKVNINGQEFVPQMPCQSKKEAKAQAARVCLQQLGVLPK